MSQFSPKGIDSAYEQIDKTEKLKNGLKNTPWYNAYRSTILETTEASDVEFWSATMGCVFLTSENAEKPHENLVTLAKQHDERSSTRVSQSTSVTPATPIGPCRHLFMPCPRSCAVVFSPTSSNDNGSRLTGVVDQTRSVLPGLNCQPISFTALDNSANPNPSALIAGLFARLARDVVLPSLLSWSERHISQLAEQLYSRRGISTQLRTIFASGSKSSNKLSMTSRGSSGSLSVSNGQSSITSNDVIYTDESSEIQLRRLSDLALLMSAFDVAFEGYHRLKDDFQRDQAVLPQATALEAAAIALLLHPQPQSRRFPSTCLKYLDNALTLYQSLAVNNPRAQYLATRCGLLYADTLRSLKLFQDAASVFARLAPEAAGLPPELELRAAISFEQSAQCWAAFQPARLRKSALHLILAGVRYNKAGYRRHSLRCSQIALPTYTNIGWALAEDLVLLSIGRQSFSLNDLETATAAFASLLKHWKDTENRHQSASQQFSFVLEYLNSASRFEQAKLDKTLPILSPIPNFPTSSIVIDPALVLELAETEVLLPTQDKWQQLATLEEISVKALTNLAVMRPSPFVFNSHSRGKPPKFIDQPSVFAKEQFIILVDVINPLDVPLTVGNLSICGKIENDQGISIFGHNESECPINIIAPAQLQLEGRQKGRFAVRINSSIAGKLIVDEICGNLCCTQNPEQMINHVHWKLDKPWNVEIHEPSANIKVTVTPASQVTQPFIPGTLVPVTLSFEGEYPDNSGIKSVVLATNRSDCFQLLDGFKPVTNPKQQSDQQKQESDSSIAWKISVPEGSPDTWSYNGIVRVSPTTSEALNGVFSISILVAYEPLKRTGKK